MRKHIAIWVAAALGFSLTTIAQAADDWPPADQRKIIDPVRAYHERITSDECNQPSPAFQGQQYGDHSWKIPVPEYAKWRDHGAFHIIRIYCGNGAYNIFHKWYVTEDEKITPLQFAIPSLDIEYRDFKKPGYARWAVIKLRVEGFRAEAGIYNSRFDPSTQTINAHYFRRGVGDAMEAGQWKVDGANVHLHHYEADVSYDTKMNPVIVFDASKNKPIHPLPESPSIKE